MIDARYYVQNNIVCVWDLGSDDQTLLGAITDAARAHLDSISDFSKGYLFQTSGSTSKPKFILHSDESLTVCAKACGKWLQLTKEDRWLNVLSDHHMGGFSTYYRSQVLALQPVVKAHWDLDTIISTLEENSCTLISLVPTQVYQIVESKIRAPKSLRVVLVGGGGLSLSLKKQAQALGWPIMRSLGSTETGSQIFTEPLVGGEDDQAVALSHFKVRTNQNMELQVKGEGLFKAYLTIDRQALPVTKESIKIEEPILDHEGYWTTSDRVELSDNKVIKFLGRTTDQVKVLGFLLDLQDVRTRFLKTLKAIGITEDQVHVDVLPDAKSENQIVLFTTSHDLKIQQAIKKWNDDSVTAERICALYYIKSFPRSHVGKIQTYRLKSLFKI